MKKQYSDFLSPLESTEVPKLVGWWEPRKGGTAITTTPYVPTHAQELYRWAVKRKALEANENDKNNKNKKE